MTQFNKPPTIDFRTRTSLVFLAEQGWCYARPTCMTFSGDFNNAQPHAVVDLETQAVIGVLLDGSFEGLALPEEYRVYALHPILDR